MKSPEKSFPYDKLGVSAKRKGFNSGTPALAVSHTHTPTSNRRHLLTLKKLPSKMKMQDGRTINCSPEVLYRLPRRLPL